MVLQHDGLPVTQLCRQVSGCRRRRRNGTALGVKVRCHPIRVHRPLQRPHLLLRVCTLLACCVLVASSCGLLASLTVITNTIQAAAIIIAGYFFVAGAARLLPAGCSSSIPAAGSACWCSTCSPRSRR